MGCCQRINEQIDEISPNTDSSMIHTMSKKLFKEHNIPASAVHIKLEASSSEQSFPLWVEPSTELKFHVRGKWQVFDGQSQVNSLGHEEIDEKVDGFNIGALIGQVLGGEYFLITDGLTYKSKNRGPLVLFQNTGVVDTQPEGFLDVFVEGARRKSFEEIERLTGWGNMNEVDTTKGHHYLSYEERKMIVTLNKVRTNPRLFARLFIQPKLARGEAYRECYEALCEAKGVSPLVPERNLYNVALSHAVDMGINGLSGHISCKGEDLKARMLNQNLEPEIIGENSSYGRSGLFRSVRRT